MTKTKVGFENHPETRKGEVLFTNVSIDEDICEQDFRDGQRGIDLRSKRIGSVAYDIYGVPILGMRPVFVQRDELQEAGIDPDTLWTK